VSTAPFDFTLIQQRLREQVPALRTVQGAADYAAVASLQDFAAPCAFVLLVSEEGEPNPPGHAMRGQVAKLSQIVVVEFGVVLAVRNYREQRGAQLADQLKQMLGDVRRALLGYVPDVNGGRACQFVKGRIQDYDAATALWVDVYQTQHSIGSQQ
jgi:hypothetical protein